MLLLFVIIFGGIVIGRLLARQPIPWVHRLITFIIWILLLLLGLEVGSDPAVVGGLATLGRTALIVCGFSVMGSILASWGLWRYVRARGAAPDADADEQTTGKQTTTWNALRGSLVIIAFFAVGSLAGYLDLAPFDLASSRVSTYVLYGLMCSVGVTLGHDTTLVGRIRRLDPRLALLPVATAIGTLVGAALAAPLLSSVTAPDALAVGAGFGYYSLSSIFIADLKSAELGAVALLCNVLRELFTLIAAPLVARWFGPLSAISIGGATTFDTTLPIITQATGRSYAVVSVFHGCMLDFSVPFLVTFFCTI